MWAWLEEWLGETWHPKIIQRQWFHKQRLYGGGYNEPEPAEPIDEEDMPPERGDG